MGSSALIKSWRSSLSLDEEAGDFQWYVGVCIYIQDAQMKLEWDWGVVI